MADLHALIHRMADELDDFNHPFPHPLAAEARRALKRLDELETAALAQHELEGPPQPIPVVERLPEPEDFDSRGLCWWFDEEDEKWCLDAPRICRSFMWSTHWLPASALPLPAEPEGLTT